MEYSLDMSQILPSVPIYIHFEMALTQSWKNLEKLLHRQNLEIERIAQKIEFKTLENMQKSFFKHAKEFKNMQKHFF